jgi:hypothetical protein
MSVSPDREIEKGAQDEASEGVDTETQSQVTLA